MLAYGGGMMKKKWRGWGLMPMITVAKAGAGGPGGDEGGGGGECGGVGPASREGDDTCGGECEEQVLRGERSCGVAQRRAQERQVAAVAVELYEQQQREEEGRRNVPAGHGRKSRGSECGGCEDHGEEPPHLPQPAPREADVQRQEGHPI